MENWKKALVVVAFLATIGGLVATQYASMKTYVKVTIDAKGALIVPVAVDKLTSSAYVLQNNSVSGAYVYQLDLGTWANYTNKTFTAAFGIVNREGHSIFLYKADFKAPSGVTVSVYVHGNSTLPAVDPDGSGPVQADTKAFDLVNNPSSNCWEIAAYSGTYSKDSLQCKLFKTYTDTTGGTVTFNWDYSGDGKVWIISSGISTYPTAKPGVSDIVFIEVTIKITTASNGALTDAHIWLYFSETQPSGYNPIT